MKTVDLMYFNAGGGHRAAALALRTAIQEQRKPWHVRLVNLTDVLDPGGALRKAVGFSPEDLYNRRLRRGWTLGLTQELKVLQGLIRLLHQPMSRQLRRYWQRSRPDMVVSLIPNFNRVMFESLTESLPDVPYVTILTDLADYPPAFWIQRNQKQHFVCGTPKAVCQAHAAGHPDSRIHATSGMIIGPDFYRPWTLDRDAERSRHGLCPGQTTGLVMFGGYGSTAMLAIARRLSDTPLILLCGHNRLLAEQLRAMPATAPRLVVEFTSEVAYYMRLSDFFIGKPGPGSISEALKQQLPLIVEQNSWTMPQERYNTQWILENELGIVLRSFRQVREAVSDLTSRLDEFRANTCRLDNRAVYEIPEIIEGILATADQALARAARPVRLQLDGGLREATPANPVGTSAS